MHDSSPIRIGIVRPAGASVDPLVAEAEARVIATELSRRVGPVLLDLRTHGDTIGPWLPTAHAAWPTAIDVRLDADRLWSSELPLTALFARTVDPVAADVRARMLSHLGLIPVEPAPFDAARLADLRKLTLTPTDLWLVARAASRVDTGEPGVDAVATPVTADGIATLDAELDAVADGVPAGKTTVSSLQQQVAALTARVAELEAAAARDARDVADRFDIVVQERTVLLDRLERTALDDATVGG